MNVIQKRKIIQRIQELETDIETLKRVRLELAESGYASATLSSTGGSKSYTRLDLDKVSHLISELLNEMTQQRRLLSTGEAKPIRTIATIYC